MPCSKKSLLRKQHNDIAEIILREGSMGQAMDVRLLFREPTSSVFVVG
jgi:hypothetical protein